MCARAHTFAAAAGVGHAGTFAIAEKLLRLGLSDEPGLLAWYAIIALVRLMLRKLPLAYAAVACALALWTWAVEIAYLGSEQEHLLPATALSLWSLPTSVGAVNALCSEAHDYCGQYGQLTLISICAAAQGAVAVLAAHRLR